MKKDQVLPFVIIGALFIGIRHFYSKGSEDKNTIVKND
tara:strand:+ start:128 stop:241 length:114 start_codon:yes stop_codon:yes gene_type:complete